MPSWLGEPRSRRAAIAASAASTLSSSATKASSRQTARTCSAAQGPRASSAGACACVMQSEGYAGGVLERSPADVYTEHCRRRELAYQVDNAGQPVFRPRVGFTTWRVSAGLGTVYATTVIRRRGAEAYNLVLVDLDEGFRMMSRVIGRPPEDVAIGARVRVAWEDDVPCFEVVDP